MITIYSAINDSYAIIFELRRRLAELQSRHAKTVVEIEAMRGGLYEKMASEDIKGRFLDPIEIQAYKMCISDMIYEFKRRFPRNG